MELRAAVGAVLLTTLAVAGCGREGGDVPAGFAPGGVDGQDAVLVSMVGLTTDGGQPAVGVVIMDRTPAEGFRLYRSTGGQGFDPIVDYILPSATNTVVVPFADSLPTRSTFGTYNRGYTVFSATDRSWSPGQAAQYLARGVVGGAESALSPLTNRTSIPAAPVESLLAKPTALIEPVIYLAPDPITGIIGPVTPEYPLGTWPTFEVEPVPGAAYYVLEVMRTDQILFFYGLYTAEAAAGGLRATVPAAPDRTGLTAANALVFQYQDLTVGVYEWTTLAFDSDWRLCGYSLRPREVGRGVFKIPAPELAPGNTALLGSSPAVGGRR